MNRRDRRAAEAAHWRRERRQETDRDNACRDREQGDQQQNRNSN